MSAVSRRAVLIGGGALATVAGLGGLDKRAPFPPLPFPAGLIPAGVDALVLHDGGAAAQVFLRHVRAVAAAGLAARAIAPLSRGGFVALADLLQRGQGAALVALLDDAEAIILETRLLQANIHGIARRRYAGQSLLTAQL